MFLRDIRNSNDLYIAFIIVVAACVVDTTGLFVWKSYPRDATISKWYDKFGLVAYMVDVSSIVIGVFIAQHVYPLVSSAWNPALFCAVAVAVQQVHDIVFAQFLTGSGGTTNDIFALLQEYVTQAGAWKILVADGVYMILTSLLAMFLYSQKPWVSTHLLALTLYVTGYALYAHAA
jgi:hypothetical protein